MILIIFLMQKGGGGQSVVFVIIIETWFGGWHMIAKKFHQRNKRGGCAHMHICLAGEEV